MSKDATGNRSVPPLAALASRLRERPVAVAVAVLLVALAIQTFVKSGSEWTEVYVDAGRRLIAGESIYGPGSAYVYPPFMAMVAAPLAFLPASLSRAIWFIANAVSLIGLLRWSWMLARGPALDAFRGWDRSERVAGLLGLACGATYLLNSLAHQQIDVVIAALLIGGCLQLSEGRDVRAGLLIGLAAACKATPMLFVAYLLWRRRWIAAVAAAAIALGANLAPDLVGAPEFAPRLRIWISQVVLPAQALSAQLGVWYSDIIYNQSLGGTIQRIVNTTLQSGAERIEVRAAPRVAGPAMKVAGYGLLALLFAASVFVARRRQADLYPVDPSLPDRASFEYSVVFALMLLASPMSSPAHFGILVLPGLCLARVAVRTGDRLLWSLLACAAFLSVFLNSDLVGKTIHTLLLWGGSITVVTLLLWVGSLAQLRRSRRRATAP